MQDRRGEVGAPGQWWLLALPQAHGGQCEGETVSPFPSGARWSMKGLSLELLWAVDISTEVTFGFQWQFYGSLYSCDHSGDVQMASLPTRVEKVVC